MDRLHSELQRLYLPPPGAGADTDAQPWNLVHPSGTVRALVLGLANPPDWEALSRVWHGVQAELDLPAPAIAASGVDALQLWFSLAEPITVARAHVFLDSLRQRFLADIAPGRVRMMPALQASAQRPELHAPRVPARQADTGNWSAFLAPDLVPVFADTPWLDIPPNEEGQATLLRGIEVARRSAFEAAVEKLGPSLAEAAAVASAAETRVHGETGAGSASLDPRRFLLQVMNDETVPLALRIEAAKALLPDPQGLRQERGG